MRSQLCMQCFSCRLRIHNRRLVPGPLWDEADKTFRAESSPSGLFLGGRFSAHPGTHKESLAGRWPKVVRFLVEHGTVEIGVRGGGGGWERMATVG